MLLIHADPGARSAFLAAWLNNTLSKPSFDVGLSVEAQHIKVHTLTDKRMLSANDGANIRIRPTLSRLDLHCLLFLRKNVYVQQPEFTRDERSLETYSKIWGFVKRVFEEDHRIDYSLYDHVIDFDQTYCIERLVDLYRQVNGTNPSDAEIQQAQATNNINSIDIDPNNACHIVKQIWSWEQSAQLDESQRCWSIVDVYQNTPPEQLYDAVSKQLHMENYSKEQCHV